MIIVEVRSFIHELIAPSQAPNKDAVSEVKKEQVPQDALNVGAVLQGQSPDGKVILARVVEIKEETVLLDYNHPLAGQTLHFDVKILAVQEALTPTS